MNKSWFCGKHCTDYALINPPDVLLTTEAILIWRISMPVCAVHRRGGVARCFPPCGEATWPVVSRGAWELKLSSSITSITELNACLSSSGSPLCVLRCWLMRLWTEALYRTFIQINCFPPVACMTHLLPAVLRTNAMPCVRKLTDDHFY